MGSRKDAIKRSLGITEYPWSSGDELEEAPPPNPEPIVTRPPVETQPINADVPGPSGLPSTPATSQEEQSSRRQARHDRDLFWTYVTNRYRMPTAGTSARSRGGDSGRMYTPDAELLQGLSRAHRLDEYRRISRGLHAIRAHRAHLAALMPPVNAGAVVPSEANSRISMNRHPSRRIAARSSLQPQSRNSRTSPQLAVRVMGASTADVQVRLRACRAALTACERPRPPRDTLSPIRLSDDEINNNPSTSARTEPEILEANNEHIGSGMEIDEALNNGNPNVTLEEIVVAEDLDGSLAPATSDGNSLALVAPARDLTDGRPLALPAAPGDATAPNNEGDNAVPVQDQRREIRRTRVSVAAEPQTVTEFNQSLLQLLECPVCLEWMEPPVWQCRRGHLVCGTCRARLATCPVCRTTFSSVRNRAMEGVAELLQYPCRHSCGAAVRLRRRAAHEASCTARRYHCPETLCAARPPVPHDGLAAHFQSQHLEMIKIGRQHKFSINMSSDRSENWFIFALEQYFYLKITVDTTAWGIVVYVCYIGPKRDAKNYTYEVTVDGHHNQRKLSYSRSTHSDLENSFLSMSRQDCFQLTLDQALNFTRVRNRREGDKYLEFNLDIAKIERQEPLEDSDG